MQDQPSELPNLESLARKYRFRILGKACRELGIDSLFLAHHEDDQAETVMMRLIQGHRILGLGGIKSESEIPECHGFYGVHESGGKSDAHLAPSASLFPDPLIIESGGIKIYRPLLGFSKARLIATCHAEGMAWFEDHTNRDPGFTTRNAVRHMLQNYALPAALGRESMVKLSKNVQLKVKTLEAIAECLLKDNRVSSFETRAGTLAICFARIDGDKLPLGSWEDRGLIAALMLRQVIMLLTPEEHVSVASLQSAVKRLFPELFQCSWTRTQPSGFTVSGLKFQPLDFTALEKKGSAWKESKWLISRQPYTASSELPNISIPLTKELLKENAWTQWQLFDGRFWFRFQNLGVALLKVRPFRKGDLKSFKRSLSIQDSRKLEHLLKSLAPGAVRWTLPALVFAQSLGNEVVFALPTLGLSSPGTETKVRWEVRFKVSFS